MDGGIVTIICGSVCVSYFLIDVYVPAKLYLYHFRLSSRLKNFTGTTMFTDLFFNIIQIRFRIVIQLRLCLL